MSDDDNKPYIGPILPGGAGNWGKPTPFDEAVQNLLELRREYASRPDVIEAQRRIAEGKAKRAAEKAAARKAKARAPKPRR